MAKMASTDIMCVGSKSVREKFSGIIRYVIYKVIFRLTVSLDFSKLLSSSYQWILAALSLVKFLPFYLCYSTVIAVLLLHVADK